MSHRPESDVRLDVDPGASRGAPRPVEERSFHVALLGDFAGRASEPASPPERLEAVPVDRDEVDAVLDRFGPVVRLGAPGGGEGTVEVRFGALDDFHPDRLVEEVPLFRSIREVARGGTTSGPSPDPPPDPGPAPVEDMLAGSVLDDILGEEEESEAQRRTGRDALQSWVEDVARPHLAAEPDAEDTRFLSKVETLVGEGMRELLRAPDFRRLEALWRGVDFLVRRVETGPRLTIHLVDVGKGAMTADREGRAFRDFLARGAGHEGEPWSVVAALWDFGTDAEELVLLRRMARSVQASGTVLLAGGDVALAGLPGLSEAGDRSAWGDPHPLWAALRREPEASSIGLALPGFLVRLPYGEDAEACERVKLEEIVGEPSPGDYVWGSPALPLVLLLARAFDRAGPRLIDAVDPDVGSLPLHLYRAGGETRAAPCTEVALTRDDADRCVDGGLMPWAWSRGDDGIRLVRLHSAADPPTGLAGWWRS